MVFDPNRPFATITSTATMVESHGACEAGSRGAPESKGECRDGACVLISEKTHVFDSANRPWLLPFIAEKATGAERDLLLTLIRHASKARDEDRPSFAQMVDHLDRFEHQKRGN